MSRASLGRSRKGHRDKRKALTKVRLKVSVRNGEARREVVKANEHLDPSACTVLPQAFCDNVYWEWAGDGERGLDSWLAGASY